jgi:hypothetical protein
LLGCFNQITNAESQPTHAQSQKECQARDPAGVYSSNGMKRGKLGKEKKKKGTCHIVGLVQGRPSLQELGCECPAPGLTFAVAVAIIALVQKHLQHVKLA